MRSIILFVHIISAMGMFVAAGLEAGALTQLRRAVTSHHLRLVLGGYGLARRVGAPSMLLVATTGIYMATVYWRWNDLWMGIGFLALLSTVAIGMTLTVRRLTRLARSVNALTVDISKLGRDPALVTSFFLRTALLIGVVFLMAVKPDVGRSLAAIGLAMLIGMLLSLAAGRDRAALTVPGVHSLVR